MPLARIKLIWKFSETPITEEVQLHMAAKVAKIEEKQESLEKQVLISGSLTARDGSQINYWPIEVSQFSISIITDFSPSQVLDALLTGPQGSIELLQTKALSNYRSSGYFYIQFRARRKLLSIEEACKLLLVSKVTIHKWKKRKLIRSYRIGRRIYFKKGEIIQALQ